VSILWFTSASKMNVSFGHGENPRVNFITVVLL
jgi:hypothetical protein